MTDKLHKNGIDLQRECLRTLILALDIVRPSILPPHPLPPHTLHHLHFINYLQITEPLQPGIDSKQAVASKMLETLSGSFINLDRGDHELCMNALFQTY